MRPPAQSALIAIADIHTTKMPTKTDPSAVQSTLQSISEVGSGGRHASKLTLNSIGFVIISLVSVCANAARHEMVFAVALWQGFYISTLDASNGLSLCHR